DERRGAGRRCQERQKTLHARHLRARGPPHRAIDGVEPLGTEALVGLLEDSIDDFEAAQHARKLLAGGHVDLSEGTVLMLLRRGIDDGKSSRFTKYPQKTCRVPADATEFPPLLDDQRPADDGKDSQDGEDELRDRTCAENQLGYAATETCISR